MKIFYNPKTLKIIGASDGENSLDFPYVETDENYHSLENLEIEKSGDKMKLKVTEAILDVEKLKAKATVQRRFYRRAKAELFEKIKNKNVRMRDLANFTSNQI